MDNEKIRGIKRDTSRLVVIFRNFVEDYKTALKTLIESVDELEAIAEELQKSSNFDGKQGGDGL